MRQFYNEYQTLQIGQSTTVQLRKHRRKALEELKTIFFNVSFSHHILILNKCNSLEEKIFYISHAATQFWSGSTLL